LESSSTAARRTVSASIVREGVAAAADVLRDDADDARDDLVAAPDEGGVVVELARLVSEEHLAGLEAE
jgi:hypothetical protein